MKLHFYKKRQGEHVCSHRKNRYIRNEDLKNIVLNELLPKHDHAELDTKLNEAAWWSTLSEKRTKYLPKAEPNLLYKLALI